MKFDTNIHHQQAFFSLQVPAAKELIEKMVEIKVGMEIVSNPIPVVYTKSMEST
jgi:hypothetical protein